MNDTKKIEINGVTIDSLLSENLFNRNGRNDEYYLLQDGVRTKLSLKELIDTCIDTANQYIEDKEKYKTRQESSRDYEQLASVADFSYLYGEHRHIQMATSGDNSIIASTGPYSHLSTSGYASNIIAKDENPHLSASGNCTELTSCGYMSWLATSGNCSRLTSSGNYSSIVSSGDHSTLFSSGRKNKLAATGYVSKIIAAGDFASVAASGISPQIISTGAKSAVASSGQETVIKAANGTWISLTQYEYIDETGIPTFALSAQIGNPDYVDNNGEVLSEENYYTLYNRSFHIVDIIDNIRTIRIAAKTLNGITIIKTVPLRGWDYAGNFIVTDGTTSAHGKTIKQAKEDYKHKLHHKAAKQELIESIKAAQQITKDDYHALTGACHAGIDAFCQRHNITTETIEIKMLLKLLTSEDYGSKEFKAIFADNQ